MKIRFFSKSGSLGSTISNLLVIVLLTVEFFIANTVNWALFAIGCCFLGVEALYEGFKLKKRSYILLGILGVLGCILSLAIYVGEVIFG